MGSEIFEIHQTYFSLISLTVNAQTTLLTVLETTRVTLLFSELVFWYAPTIWIAKLWNHVGLSRCEHLPEVKHFLFVHWMLLPLQVMADITLLFVSAGALRMTQ